VATFSGKIRTEEDVEPVPITTEDYGAVMLRFHGGARGVVWVSQVTAGRKNGLRFELAGSKQAIAWDSERPNELWIGHRDRANELLVRDPALLSVPARRHADYPGGHNEGFPDTFKQLFRAFYDYLAAGDLSAQPPFPTFADGHHEVLLCEAIGRSHREGRWVEVGEPSS
jgi:predicted dehydrogenase